jgi:hypothetical protein
LNRPAWPGAFKQNPVVAPRITPENALSALVFSWLVLLRKTDWGKEDSGSRSLACHLPKALSFTLTFS